MTKKSAGSRTDVIIPRTETPGASDVGVPAYIDTFLTHAPTEVDAFRLGMRTFDEASRELTGMAFDELDPSRQAPTMRTIIVNN
jgi:hypothetical protein